jgi:hypothetical protein
VLEQPAKGTRFLVRLPVEMPDVREARPAELGPGVPELPAGHARAAEAAAVRQTGGARRG